MHNLKRLRNAIYYNKTKSNGGYNIIDLKRIAKTYGIETFYLTRDELRARLQVVVFGVNASAESPKARKYYNIHKQRQKRKSGSIGFSDEFSGIHQFPSFGQAY